MQLLRFLFLVAVLALPIGLLAAEAPAVEADAAHGDTHAAAEEHHGLPPAAVDLFRIGPLPVTNSMMVTWAVALGLIIFAQVATRKIQVVPTGLQNFWEWLVESLHDFLEGVIGSELVKKTFWFFAPTFIFI